MLLAWGWMGFPCSCRNTFRARVKEMHNGRKRWSSGLHVVCEGKQVFHETLIQHRKNGFCLLPILARKIFHSVGLVQMVMMSWRSHNWVCCCSGRAGNEIGLGGVSQVWSARTGLIHLRMHTRAHNHKKQWDSAEGNARTCKGSWGGGGWTAVKLGLLG